MKRLLSVMMILALLAAFAVGAVGLRVAFNNIVQSGSWQQAEVRWFGIPEWEITPLQGEVQIEHIEQDTWRQILTLRAAPGEIAHVRVTVDHTAFELWLFCDEELQAALAQAQDILQHPGRFHASYITQLQATVARAERFYATAWVTPEEFTETLQQLQELGANPQSPLLSGGLLGRFAPTWWNLLDNITAPLRRMTRAEIIIPLLGRIVSAVFSRQT